MYFSITLRQVIRGNKLPAHIGNLHIRRISITRVKHANSDNHKEDMDSHEGGVPSYFKRPLKPDHITFYADTITLLGRLFSLF